MTFRETPWYTLFKLSAQLALFSLFNPLTDKKIIQPELIQAFLGEGTEKLSNYSLDGVDLVVTGTIAMAMVRRRINSLFAILVARSAGATETVDEIRRQAKAVPFGVKVAALRTEALVRALKKEK